MSLFAASPKRFLAPRERERVMEAIRSAEKKTSGEIRVHIERRCPGSPPDPLRRAAGVFARLGMTKTAQRNGVILYIALVNRQFAVWGDEGINSRVGNAYWEKVRDALAARFQAGEFCDGLCDAVASVGETLATLFPPRPGDINELPEEISTEE